MLALLTVESNVCCERIPVLQLVNTKNKIKKLMKKFKKVMEQRQT